MTFHDQALVHYVTIARENPQPKLFLTILPRGTHTSEPSGPIPMSATASSMLCLVGDDEVMVSLECVEQVMELFCLGSGEV